MAVQVIVVELFVQVLEHGDPLDDVHSLVAISIIVGPNEKKNRNESTVMEMYKSETSHHHRNVIIIIILSTMLWFCTWLVECYGFCCCLFDYSTTRVVVVDRLLLLTKPYPSDVWRFFFLPETKP